MRQQLKALLGLWIGFEGAYGAPVDLTRVWQEVSLEELAAVAKTEESGEVHSLSKDQNLAPDISSKEGEASSQNLSPKEESQPLEKMAPSEVETHVSHAKKPHPKKSHKGQVRIVSEDVTAIENIGIQPKEGAYTLSKDIWKGVSRSTILALYKKLPTDISSPVLRRVAYLLLTSPFVIPKSPNPLEERSLTILRAEKLYELGFFSEAKSLLETHRHNLQHPLYKKLFVIDRLVKSDFKGAVPVIKEMLVQHQEPFWAKAMATCQVLEGKTDEALLSLSLLNEALKDDEKDFIRAAQLLLAPEFAENVDPIQNPDLFTIILLSRFPEGRMEVIFQKIPLETQERILSYFPNIPISADLRLNLYEKSAVKQYVTPSFLKEHYGLYLEAHPHIQIKTSFEGLKGAPLRALMAAAVRKTEDPETRRNILNKLLQSAKEEGVYLPILEIMRPFITEIKPEDGAAHYADMMIPALVGLRQFDDLSHWHHYISIADSDPSLVPLVILFAKKMDNTFKNDLLKKWILFFTKDKEEQSTRYVAHILTLLTCAGIKIPHALWEILPEEPSYDTHRLSRGERALLETASKEGMVGVFLSYLVIALDSSHFPNKVDDNIDDVVNFAYEGKSKEIGRDLAAEAIETLTKAYVGSK